MEQKTKEQELELNSLRTEVEQLRSELQDLVYTCGISDYTQTSNNLQRHKDGYFPKTILTPPDLDLGGPRIGAYFSNPSRTPDYEKWKDTFFYTHAVIATSLARTYLSDSVSTSLRNAQKYHPSFVSDMDYMYGSYLVSTEAVLPTKDGPRFVFADPYGSIITDPCAEIDTDFAESLIGQIVIARIGHRFDSDSHPLKKLRITEYSKYEPTQK